jgi:hypothetical protein
MTWAKVDDGLHSHPKIMALWRQAPAALGLHLLGLSFAGAYLTDGVIHRAFVEERATVELADELVAAGLWDRDGENFKIHDFLDFNPSRASVLREKKASAQRAKVARQRRNGARA